MKIHRSIRTLALFALAATFVMMFSGHTHAAEGFALLKGFWRCQEDGVQSSLEFRSQNQLVFNGQSANYQLQPGAFTVMEDTGPATYFYQYLEGTLIILSPDGSATYCQKAAKPPGRAHKKTPPSSQPQTTSGSWPPPYRKPAGNVSWEDSSPGKLLYKFAGRWDSVTSNTLHNFYLKPDGTFEEYYESGYSGQFTDQGGYQTGSWDATGNEQSSGYWTIQGTLRQGTISLTYQNGNRSNFQYQVHCRGSECYGGEYFFNGKLYSVNYIYR